MNEKIIKGATQGIYAWQKNKFGVNTIFFINPNDLIVSYCGECLIEVADESDDGADSWIKLGDVFEEKTYGDIWALTKEELL